MAVNPAVYQLAQTTLGAYWGTTIPDAVQAERLDPVRLAEALRCLNELRPVVAGQPLANKALSWLQIELKKRASSDRPLDMRRSEAIAGVRSGAVARKAIPGDLMHVTEKGGLVLMPTPTAEGKPRNIVLRTVPWVTRELFPLGGAILYVSAGARLDLQTGVFGTDLEFVGYRSTFIDHHQADVVVYEDEVASYRRILGLSYQGRRWNVSQDATAAQYAEDATDLVPDLHAEAVFLESRYDLETHHGNPGLWNFHALKRGGLMAFEDFDLLDQGSGVWSLFEGGIYLGDIDTASFPMPSPEIRFGESVFGMPELEVVRTQALTGGAPTFLSLGGGSGFTPEKAASHLLFDGTRGLLVDPNSDVLEDLKRLGIPLERITDIFVSHVHFDHVSGFWRLLKALPHKPRLHIQAHPDDVKALQSGQWRIRRHEVSTLTALVEMALLASGRQCRARDLMDLFTLAPITYHRPMRFGSLDLTFFHPCHSHITTSYHAADAASGRPVLLVTGDSVLDAARLDEAVCRRAMSPVRQNFLSSLVLEFLKAGALVVGDMGVPPLHPAPGYYSGLQEGLRRAGLDEDAIGRLFRQLYGYHVSVRDAEAAGFQHVGWGWKTALPLSRPDLP